MPENNANPNEWIDEQSGFKKESVFLNKKGKETKEKIKDAFVGWKGDKTFNEIILSAPLEPAEAFIPTTSTRKSKILIARPVRKRDFVITKGYVQNFTEKILRITAVEQAQFEAEILNIENELIAQLIESKTGKVFLIRPPTTDLYGSVLSLNEKYHVTLFTIFGSNKFIFRKKEPLSKELVDELFRRMDQELQKNR